MKYCIATLVINCVLMSATALADEQLPVLKVGSETYSNVTVTSVSATDIYFKFDKGVGNAKLKKLEPAMQQHFQAQAAKVAATEQKRITANTQPAAPAGSQQELDATIAKVKAIINQPVPSFPVTQGMEFSTYRPGWFHDGAIKPDFNKVDIRHH